MADRTLEDFMDRIKIELNDPNMTRFTTTHYRYATEEAVRAVKRAANMVNPDFLQYKLGEKSTLYQATYSVMTTGNVTAVALSGTARAIPGGSTNELFDEDVDWIEDIWDGYSVAITTGTGTGQRFTIASNTPSTLMIEGTWTTEPDLTSQYEIYPPTDVIYESDRTAPLPSDRYVNAYVRIQSGTGIGQERKIEKIDGYEITVEEAWTTQPADGDEYNIVAVTQDFALPSDFHRVVHVKVDGKDCPGWRPRLEAPEYYEPRWSIIGTNLHFEKLGGGETIEFLYDGESTSLTTDTASVVQYGDTFFDAIKYYVLMKLKGDNEENIQNNSRFYQPIRSEMLKTMTDFNKEEGMHIESPWEDFEG